MELKLVCADEKYQPKYANDTDACMDVKVRIESDSVTIKPNEVVKLSTGIQAAIPEGYVMKLYVRSSIGIKNNLALANGTGIIDAGYRDEIILALYNYGKQEVVLHDGDRVGQFILLPFPKVDIITVEDNEDFRNGDRGGGIGSTGTN